MLRIINSAPVVGALLGILLMVGGGCNPKKEPEPEKKPEPKPKDVGKLPAELLTLRADMAAAKTQIGVVASTLDAMVANADTDPRPYFKQFADAVEKLQKQRDSLRANREAMDAQGEAYFTKWEEELAKVSTEDVKKRFTARRDELLKAQEAVTDAVRKGQEIATPYLSDLEDLKKIIDNDPNAANIKGLEEQFKKTKAAGEAVGEALDEIASKVKGIAAIYSPGA
jgi:hypothetical protein